MALILARATATDSEPCKHMRLNQAERRFASSTSARLYLSVFRETSENSDHDVIAAAIVVRTTAHAVSPVYASTAATHPDSTSKLRSA